MGVAAMRSAGVRRMLVSMTAEIAHIEIEVRVEGEAICGEAGRNAGRPRPFMGWIGRPRMKCRGGRQMTQANHERAYR